MGFFLFLFLILTGLTSSGCSYQKGFLVADFAGAPHWLKISTYGLMMAMGFLTANYLLQKEFHRLKMPQKLADHIIIISVIGGIIGAKLFFVWETSAEIESFSEAIDSLFSGGGLTWYGGLVVATLGVFILFKKHNLKFLPMADIITPMMASGYGFGRLGCLVSGDGCYGVACGSGLPSPLCMSFPDGAAPWSKIVNMYNDPNVTVYNTPLYEASFSFILFLFFWIIRKKEWTTGFKFFTFILLHSAARYAVEIIRLNPKDVFGMTQAQFVSLVLIGISISYMVIKTIQQKRQIQGG